MTQIPADVLLLIFPLLITRDQLECMTVCRQWNDLILHHSIFRAIYIDNEQQLNSLVQIVKSDLLFGKKVEQLSLLNDNVDVSMIDTLFHNVRQFTVKDINHYSGDIKPFKSLQSSPWCEYIETITECCSEVYTTALLHSGLCKNLTLIAVRRQYKETPHNLIKALTNAPGLKTLHLYHYGILFQELELLHETVPLLNSLSLKGIDFGEVLTSSDIRPASLLKSFQYLPDNLYHLNYFGGHFPYISQKYTCLEELVLYIQPVDSWGTSGICSIEEQKEMFSAYIVTLGPQLKTLKLFLEDISRCGMDEICHFDILDQAGCKLENMALYGCLEITILDRLARSYQTEYIRSLTITWIFIGAKEDNYFEWLSSFTMLKELSLGFSPDPQPIDEPAQYTWDNSESVPILTSILLGLGENKLETLRLNDVNLIPDEENENLVFPSLRKLELFGVHFAAGADLEISRLLPNLKFLKLENCLKDTDIFALPSTDLYHLEIVNSEVKKNFSLSITTLRNSEQRLYNNNTKYYFVQPFWELIERHSFTFPLIYTSPFFITDDIPIRNIVCSSVYNFDMFNNKDLI